MRSLSDLREHRLTNLLQSYVASIDAFVLAQARLAKRR
jgi:hypothetical protein